jgi:hypothetical protein
MGPAEYDRSAAPCSSTSRASTRRAVCRSFLGASRSARSIASIAVINGASRGELRTGALSRPDRAFDVAQDLASSRQEDPPVINRTSAQRRAATRVTQRQVVDRRRPASRDGITACDREDQEERARSRRYARTPAQGRSRRMVSRLNTL